MPIPILTLYNDGGLAALRAAKDKGPLLEATLEDILLDSGFTAVRRQASGSQYGYDLIAVKRQGDRDGEAWLFECKNLNRRVTVNDIAPKLVWHLTRVKIDHFVIVSPSDVANDVAELLSNHPFTMPVSTWTGRTLEALILSSPRARARLGISSAIPALAAPTITMFPPRERISFHVAPQAPRSVADYFFLDGGLVKADTHLDLCGIVGNQTEHSFTIHQLFAVTREYRTVTGRVLRQHTPRALRTPEKLYFSLRPQAGTSIEMLNGQVWEIPAHGSDTISLRLSGDVAPGFYVVSFEAHGVLAERRVVLDSVRSFYHVLDPQMDVLTVIADIGFCETPSKRLLEGPEEEWRSLKREAQNGLTLGPTFMQTFNRSAVDSNWLVRVARPIGPPTTRGGFTTTPIQHEIILDLGIPFDRLEPDDSRRTPDDHRS